MRHLSQVFCLILPAALLLTAPGFANPAPDNQSFDNEPIARESTMLDGGPVGVFEQAPKQEQGNAEALAEASQLTRTVVKLFDEGKYDEALPLAKRALALREAALGSDHELVQGSLLNLAELYLALRKYGDAQTNLERLLRTHEQKVGPEDAGAAIFLDKLAYLYFAQRDFKRSEAAYQRSLAIREKAFGPNSAEFATSLYALAEFYRFRNKFEEAEPLFERAALLREKLFGRDNPEYQKTRDRYFCLVYETGDSSSREKRLKEFANKLGDNSRPQSSSIEGGVLNGVAISMPRPAYPAEARDARARGTVVVKVTIDEYGAVVEAADMCTGNPLLVKPSIQAARLARFTPTKLSGKPVRVTGVITYNFVVR